MAEFLEDDENSNSNSSSSSSATGAAAGGAGAAAAATAAKPKPRLIPIEMQKLFVALQTRDTKVSELVARGVGNKRFFFFLPFHSSLEQPEQQHQQPVTTRTHNPHV